MEFAQINQPPKNVPNNESNATTLSISKEPSC